LQIAPSDYRRYAAQQRNPELQCARVKRDAVLMPEIQRVWQANMKVYGSMGLTRSGASFAASSKRWPAARWRD